MGLPSMAGGPQPSSFHFHASPLRLSSPHITCHWMWLRHLNPTHSSFYSALFCSLNHAVLGAFLLGGPEWPWTSPTALMFLAHTWLAPPYPVPAPQQPLRTLVRPRSWGPAHISVLKPGSGTLGARRLCHGVTVPGTQRQSRGGRPGQLSLARPGWCPCRGPQPWVASAFPTQLVSSKDQCSRRAHLRGAFSYTVGASEAVGNPPASEHRGGHPARAHRPGGVNSPPRDQDAAVLRSSCCGLICSSVRPSAHLSVNPAPSSGLALGPPFTSIVPPGGSGRGGARNWLRLSHPTCGPRAPSERKGCRAQVQTGAVDAHCHPGQTTPPLPDSAFFPNTAG